MTLTAPPPAARRDDATHVLFEEARRRRQRRWTIGIVLTVALSVGASSAVLVTIGGFPSPVHRTTSPHLLGLLTNTHAYMECPGSAHVGPRTSPDVLPANGSGTSNLSFVEQAAENMANGSYLGFSHPVSGLPLRRSVRAVRVGPGGGWVWSKNASGKIRVVPAKNYGIDVYLKEATQCPVGGWARWSDNGIQVTFFAPRH